MIRATRRIVVGLIVMILVLLAIGQRFGDPSLAPRSGELPIVLQVVDYGYHAALFVPRAALRDAAVAAHAGRLVAVTDRFAAFDTLEFGWGDEVFYRSVPTISDLQLWPAIRAGLGLDDGTVLLVVGRQVPSDAAFAGASRAAVAVSPRALARMAGAIETTLAGSDVPEELGTGLYGPSLFYRATGHYSAINVCNHWLGRLFVAAGRPVNLTLATLSPWLVWQLQ
jgi:hypothetical protein